YQVFDHRTIDRIFTSLSMHIAILSKALETVEPGAMVLNISHGDGADALLFRATDEKRKDKTLSVDGPSLEIPTYAVYRKRRDFTRAGPEEGAVLSNVMLEKEERQNVRLHATRCPKCETVQFPLAAVCVKFHNHDELEEVRMAR